MELSKAFAIGQQRAMSIRQAQTPGIPLSANREIGELSPKTATTNSRSNPKKDREKIGELVGSIFYSTLIKQMQDSSFKSKLFHGGRGEEAFNGQLAQELSARIGRAKQEPVSNAIYRATAHRRKS